MRNYLIYMILSALAISGCAIPSHFVGAPDAYFAIAALPETGDRFEAFEPNRFKRVADEPVSTFSADVDTASYSYIRRRLNSGVLPQKDAVRIEEMINYFDYSYPQPSDRNQPFQPVVAVTDSPWSKGRKLIHIGIKGFDISPEANRKSNLVFLLDVSGSMQSDDKLPLVKKSMELLISQLNADDTVGIVVYAGAAGVVLEPTKVVEKSKIPEALRRLEAGGSTAGGEGLQLAYQLAETHFDENALNRIILATDGDFNVGITDQRELQSFIERKRDQGIYLSVLGFGQGNYQDARMQMLAQNGNGIAAYIDTLNEAQKVLVKEANANLFPIAKNVKLQVEFNPQTVAEYRLIGYETRLLNRDDFKNDKVDAGDIGAGHSVTALYEITPVNSDARLYEDNRYGNSNIENENRKKQLQKNVSGEYAFLKIRYQLPHETQSKLISRAISEADERTDDGALDPARMDTDFAIAVAAFGQLLKGDRYTENYNYDDVIALAQKSRGDDEYGFRNEFLQLVRMAKTASAM